MPADVGEARIRIPDRIARGEIIQVSSIISHPMDTGFFESLADDVPYEIGALLALLAAPALAAVRVVATTTDLAALVREVGGNLVTVESIVPAGVDPEALWDLMEPDWIGIKRREKAAKRQRDEAYETLSAARQAGVTLAMGRRAKRRWLCASQPGGGNFVC